MFWATCFTLFVQFYTVATVDPISTSPSFISIILPDVMFVKIAKTKIKFKKQLPMVDLEVGNSTSPKQYFKVGVDTGCTATWLLSQYGRELAEGSISTNVKRYRDDGRIVYQNYKTHLEFGDGTRVDGFYAFDAMKLKSMNYYSKLNFISGYELRRMANGMNDAGESGYVGLAGFNDLPNQIPSIRSLSFMYNIDSSIKKIASFYPTGTNNRFGCLILGEFNQDLIERTSFVNPPSQQIYPGSSTRLWTAESYVKVTANTPLFPVKINVTFDSGTTSTLHMPGVLYNNFFGVLIERYPQITIPSTADQYEWPAWFNCTNFEQTRLPMIIFCFPATVCKFEMALDYNDYVYQSGTDCFIDILKHDSNAHIMVGIAAFKKYFIGYDYDTNRLILGKANRNFQYPAQCTCCITTRNPFNLKGRKKEKLKERMKEILKGERKKAKNKEKLAEKAKANLKTNWKQLLEAQKKKAV